MPVTPRYKRTPPKIGNASEITLKFATSGQQINSKESVMRAAEARASKPKKSKKKR